MIIFAAIIGLGVTLISLSEDPQPHPVDITVSINYPNAGTLSTAGEQIMSGDHFTCSVVSTATGYTFNGWYVENNLMSTSWTYTFVAHNDTAVKARFSIIHDASFTVTPTTAKSPTSITMTSKYNVEIAQRSWVVQDVLTGEKLSNKTAYNSAYDSYSLYITKGRALSITQTVTYSDGQTATSNTVKVVDETVTTNFAWKYQSNEKWYSIFTSFFGVLNNGSVTWDVPLSFSWYYSALSSSVPRAAGYDSLEKYVTYTDPTIRSMAQGLLSYTSGMSDIDRVNFVLKFVQSLPYQYDIKGKGVDEYWKLPAETLWEGKGDCEDHAFLFASLIKAMGYKVALHYIYCYEGGKFIGAHLAVGVAVPGGSGSYLAINGVKYYYCEATAEVGTSWINDYNVGHQPSGYVIQQTWIV